MKNIDLENEKEWRRHIMSQLVDIQKDQKEIMNTISTNKTKIDGFTSFFTIALSAATSFIFSLINKGNQ